jgi:hypothetical protein
MAKLEVLYHGGTEENHKSSVSIVSVPAEIRTEHLRNIKQKRYSFSQLPQWGVF